MDLREWRPIHLTGFVFDWRMRVALVPKARAARLMQSRFVHRCSALGVAAFVRANDSGSYAGVTLHLPQLFPLVPPPDQTSVSTFITGLPAAIVDRHRY
jgi:hypothetical protein